jgi:hypothetical protein
MLYSNFPTLNADATRVYYAKAVSGVSQGMYWSSIDGTGETKIANSFTDSQGHWHPTDPDLFIYFSGSSIVGYDASDDSTNTIHNFGSTLWSGGTQEIVDRTGKYFVASVGGATGTLKVVDIGDPSTSLFNTGDDVEYSGGPTLSDNNNPGWLTMVPDGSAVLVGTCDNNACGTGEKTKWYPLDHEANSIGAGTEITNNVGHEDVVCDDAGDCWLISGTGTMTTINGKSGAQLTPNPITYAGGNFGNFTAIIRVELSATPEDNWDIILDFRSDWSLGWHSSCNVVTSGLRNYCIIDMEETSGYWDADPWTPFPKFRDEIILVDVTATRDNQKHIRLTDHRSRDFSYNSDPKASISPDGTKVAFNSTFGRGDDYVWYVDVYTVTTGLSAGTPEVTETGTDATATEEGISTGYFTIACDPACSTDTIHIAMSGGATQGTDYTLDSAATCDGTTWTTTVTADGATTLVYACPIDDAIAEEGTETVTLTVQADQSGADYTVGSPTSDDVEIEDNDILNAKGVSAISVTIQ